MARIEIFMGVSRRRGIAGLTSVVLLIAGCSDDLGDGSETETETEGPGSASVTGDASASESGESESGESGESESGESESGDDGLWMTPYCFSASDAKWLAAWIEAEAEVIDRVNAVRAEGTRCGAFGDFAPAAPLTRSDHLTCAARVHSQDMVERDFFSHVNPDGEAPSDRVDRTGYLWQRLGENIAGGPDNAADAVKGWLASDDHCANLMSPDYKELGIGLYEGAATYTFYWTQVFGTPR